MWGGMGINTYHLEEAVTVHGSMQLTGHLQLLSDMRAKENVV